YSLPCGASWRLGSYHRGRNSKRRKRCFGAESGLGPDAGGGGPLNFRVLPKSRRIEGVASHRPSSSRRKTHGESGDGWWSPHGGKVVVAARSPHHRKPPDQSGRWNPASRECREEKNRQEGLTTAADRKNKRP